MILINEVKYACMECIRGHRSSMCRHHQRPLLQVRLKGRPNVGYGNKNHRIAVFAEEIASLPEPEDGDSCRDFPVVILKASDKQVIDLLNGQILGPYSEAAKDMYNTKPVIRSDSFINSSSCCSKGASKVSKQCSCNKANVSKTKILKSYFDKHKGKDVRVKKEPQVVPAKLSCCSSKKQANGNAQNENGYSANIFANPYYAGQLNNATQPQQTYNMSFPQMPQGYPPLQNKLPQTQVYPDTFQAQPQSQQDMFHNFAASNTGEIFEVVNVPSCSILGTCRCTADCKCPGCVEHNNAPKPQAEVQLESLRNDAQYGSNLILTLKEQKHTEQRQTQPMLPPVSFPKDFDTYANFLRQIIGDSQDVQEAQNGNEPERVANEEQACECPEEACFCTNCEAHGIIDGYRLDDIFNSRTVDQTIKTEPLDRTSFESKRSSIEPSTSVLSLSSNTSTLGKRT
ncbi:hypothetical protein C7M61_004884 [Candidozyma pseudohaemuli]|uniref:Copper-fist domain-containing protein n=1 Tax=Candidozyma pseudohaemuli TaxID=418784 RepID=A0A2P7YFF7_9ASCO|nr:hypothetical protein C7M61_004884 [[Candida] pseudohaemulonii]PSK34692.1 hypothetical protein C7M61_004884 [[Candida] pseudohaemulonii]